MTGSRSAGWGIADQLLSSGTNFGLLWVAVRSVDVASFGAFSLVYVLYVFVIPLLRSTATVPLTVCHADDDEAGLHAAATANLRYAFSVGLLLGAACLAGAVFIPRPIRELVVVLGLAFPLLLVQDAARGVFFLRSQFGRATLNDAVWAVVQFGVLGGLLMVGPGVPVVWFVLAWVAGGAVGGVLALAQLSVRLRVVCPLDWLRRYGSLARPLFVSMVFTVAPAQLTYLLMPAVSTLTDLGEVRGAYVLFGPLNVAFTAASTVMLPRAVRADGRRLRGIAVRVSLVTSGLALLWACGTVLLPARLGELLLPGIWDSTGTVRLFLALSLVAEGALVGPTLALSALSLPQRLARVRYWTGPATLALGLLLAAWFGAQGVAMAFFLGYSATAVAAWLTVQRSCLAFPA